MNITIVDSAAAIVSLLDCIEKLPSKPPSLYLDIEGLNLSRHGSISIIQVLVQPKNHYFLIDIHLIKHIAFDKPNRLGTTFRNVLESNDIAEVFFDVRNDADALFAHFNIFMQGIHDVQLLEVASRRASKRCVMGLTGCTKRDANMTEEQIKAFMATKDLGLKLFAPELDGSYEVFNSRPLRPEIVEYFTQDVVFLPKLWTTYKKKISPVWAGQVQEATVQRLLGSQAESYVPHGKEKVLSPWAKITEAKPSFKDGRIKASAVKKLQVAPQEEAIAQAEDQKIAQQPGIDGILASPVTSVAGQKRKDVDGSCIIDISTRVQTLLRSGESINAPMSKPPKDVFKFVSNTPQISPLQVWSCNICRQEMQYSQKDDHLGGKMHAARSRAVLGPIDEAAPIQNMDPTYDLTKAVSTLVSKAPTPNSKGKKKRSKAAKLRTRAKDEIRLSTNTVVQHTGAPYPPDHAFVGFSESICIPTYDWETSPYLETAEYGLCDSDCGWCGHCMDGLDI